MAEEQAKIVITADSAPFVRAMEEARRGREQFTGALEDAQSQHGKTEAAIKADIKTLEKLERERRRGLSTSGKLFARLADLEAMHVKGAKAAALHEASMDSLRTKGMKRLRNEIINGDRAFAEFFDEQNRHIDALKESREASQALALVYGQQRKRLDALETAMGSLGIPGESLVKIFREQKDALETINEAGTPAEARMLKVGIAIGTVAAVGAAAVAATAAIGAGLVALTANAAEASRELEPLGLQLDALGQRQADKARASIDALFASMKGVGAEIGGAFAPSLTNLNTILVAGSLATRDYVNTWLEGGGIIEKVRQLFAKGLTEALFLPLKPMEMGYKAIRQWKVEMGLATGNIDGFLDGLEEAKAALTANTDQGFKYMLNAGLEPLKDATRDYIGEAEKLIARQMAVNATQRDGAGTARDLAAEYEALIEAYRQANTLTEEQIQLRQFEQDAFLTTAGLEESVMADLDAAADAQLQTTLNRIAQEMAAEQALRDLKEANAKAGVKFASDAAKATATIMEALGKDSARVVRAAFALERGAAIGSVIYDTSKAVAKAAASAPFPANVPGVTFALLTGGSALASAISATISGGGSLPSIGGGGGTYSTGGTTETTGAATAAGLGGGPSPVAVSDAYVPPVGGPRTLRLAPGDEARISRSGPMGGNGDTAALARMADRIIALLSDVHAELVGMRTDRTMERAVFAARGPARGY